MKRVGLLLLAFAIAAGFVRLGFWQLHRAQFKQALIDASQRVLAQRHALPLGNAPGVASDAYAWVAGDGHFPALPAVRLDDQVRDGVPGMRVYRVFEPDGGARAVLVEFGWRALASHRAIPPEPPPPVGDVHVAGLLAPPPAGGLLLGGDGTQREPDGSLLLLALDPVKVAAELHVAGGLAPRVLQLDPAIVLGYPRDLRVDFGRMTPARHRGYAVQWFALAAGLSIASLVVFCRKTR